MDALPLVNLPPRVNLSTTTLFRAGQAAGTGWGHHGLPCPAQSGKAGKEPVSVSEIKLSAKSGDVFEQVARDLSEIPEVLECHLISGDFDYLVKARLKEMSAYRRLLGDLLKSSHLLLPSHSYVVMEEVKGKFISGCRNLILTRVQVVDTTKPHKGLCCEPFI